MDRTSHEIKSAEREKRIIANQIVLMHLLRPLIGTSVSDKMLNGLIKIAIEKSEELLG